jgi:hypothetical protein
MRSKNEVLCAEAGSLIAERSEAYTNQPNYLRNVNKPGRRLGRLIN